MVYFAPLWNTIPRANFAITTAAVAIAILSTSYHHGFIYFARANLAIYTLRYTATE